MEPLLWMIGTLTLLLFCTTLAAIVYVRAREHHPLVGVLLILAGGGLVYGLGTVWARIEGPLRLEPGPVLRVEIARGLGSGDNPRAGRYLLRALVEDEDARVRAACACALGELRHAGALHPLLTAVTQQPDEADDVKICALRALRLLNNVEAVPALLSQIGRGSAALRIETVQTLGALRDVRAAAALIGLVTANVSDEEKEAARLALGAIGTAAMPLVRALLRTSPRDAIDVLRHMGEPGAAELLGIFQRMPNLRSEATRGLLLSRDASSLATLRSQMATNLRLVAQAYQPLIELGDDSFVPLLARALESHGSARMAVDYLNCGQTALTLAAQRWARANGYEVMDSFGGASGPRWGRR